jgi:hypothetical protein
MPKRGMDSCRLYALTFNYLDLLFSQPVKLVDQGIYLLRVVFGYMAQGIDLYKALRFRSNVARAVWILVWIYLAYYATVCLSIFRKESNIGINYTSLI